MQVFVYDGKLSIILVKGLGVGLNNGLGYFNFIDLCDIVENQYFGFMIKGLFFIVSEFDVVILVKLIVIVEKNNIVNDFVCSSVVFNQIGIMLSKIKYVIYIVWENCIFD